MKAIRFFVIAILVLIVEVAQAQSVWIYKKDGTQVAYDASLIEKVEYAEFCTVNDVELLEGYNIDEGKHAFSESLIVNVGSALPIGSTTQFGVVCTQDKTTLPTRWGSAKDAVASSDGVWQVWAKVIPAGNNGYKEDVIRIGEVRISETDYGYYSFNATSIEGIKDLSLSDFTKLTKAISEETCGKRCFPVVLTTGTTAPVMTWWSNGGNGYGMPQTMDSETDYSGLTITINGTKYNVWCEVNPTGATDTSKIKIEIK